MGNVMSLHEMRTELTSIINELRNLEHEIRNGYSGIGQDMCANCIGAVADHYQFQVLSRLNNMDQNLITNMLANN